MRLISYHLVRTTQPDRGEISEVIVTADSSESALALVDGDDWEVVPLGTAPQIHMELYQY